MPRSLRRLLIVDQEALIAVDIETLFREMTGCVTSFAQLADLAAIPADVELVLVGSSLPPARRDAVVDRLRRQGLAVLIGQLFAPGVQALAPDVAILPIPPDTADVRAALTALGFSAGPSPDGAG